jgi:periplasmic glucans biosynthesis protein
MMRGAKIRRPATGSRSRPVAICGQLARLSGRGFGALALALALLIGGSAGTPPEASAFGLDDVTRRAEEAAGRSFRDDRGDVPDWLVHITYDQWRDIRFRPAQALWRGESPFEVQFFHPGLFYDRIIKINIVDGNEVRPLEFDPQAFDYGKNDFGDRVPRGVGFAGFRVHYPIKNPRYADEVIVFLGASYFRSLGRDQAFGLSARGLAVDTAEPGGEEFPRFREFWLVKPASDATTMTIYALLDGPSVVGAYRFEVSPDAQTRIGVDVKLFLRESTKKLGLAPLTSMFFHGENRLQPFVDFRPEVHDSDGLLVASSSGEWIWRPLENPTSLHTTSVVVADPRGFGLMQRDRAFESYQDLEARSELRPSVWIEPTGAWGKGRVELVEIPTRVDIHDNVVVYWVPEARPAPRTPYAFAYSMRWYGDDPAIPPGGRVLATRRDFGTVPDAHRFVVDFGGDGLASIPAEQAPRAVVTVVGGPEVAEILDQQVVKNPVNGQWRLSFQLRPKTIDAIDLRAFLDRGGEALTETWSYTLVP